MPDLDGRDMPTAIPEVPYGPDIGPLEGVDRGKQDSAETERTGECPVHEVVGHSPAPSEPDLTVSAVQEQYLKQVELHLREHPPRDFRKEKATEVYQGYVGFTEIHVTGATLATTAGTIGVLDYRYRRLDWLDLVRHRSRTHRPTAGNAFLRPCGRQAVPVSTSKTGGNQDIL